MAVLPTGIGPVTGGYQIERSLRFNSADSAYLNRTPASAGSLTTWTWSGWVKRGTISASLNVPIFSAGTSGTNDTNITFNGDIIDWFNRNSSSINGRLNTTQVFRDPSGWYHLVFVWDTTNATASNRMRIYVNGSLITALSVATYPGSSQSSNINNNVVTYIGLQTGTSNYFDGYMTEINFIDGQALTPSDFGETDSATGVWKPKKFSGTYGTNGFYLNFSDNSNTTAATLGKDSSGNGNNWTPNNFSVTAGAGNDSLVDTPTSYGSDTDVGGEVRGNYCTWSPVDRPDPSANTYTLTLSNGNLDTATGGAEGVVNNTTLATFQIPTTGKWYWEILVTNVATLNSTRTAIGIMNQAAKYADGSDFTYATVAGVYAYAANGQKATSPGLGLTNYGNSYTNNDVIGVAVDSDAGKIWFAKNGTWQNSGSPTGGTNEAFSGLVMSQGFQPAIGYWLGCTANFGQRAFSYTAPSGFKALNTFNLPTPTIGATSTTQAGKYFNTVLYTGTGSSLGVTGVGFQPDWTWIKSRSAATDHGLYDAVRGVQKQLESNNTDAETTETTGLTAFNSDGFTVGALAQLNTNTATYVGWNWKANGAGSSNTSGTITSTVSANTTAGFSIVTYTGNGSSSATVGHGLGVVPAMVITKGRSSATEWMVKHQSLPSGQNLILNQTLAASASTGFSQGVIANLSSSTTFGFTAGSSGVDNANQNGVTFVAYCFAEVAGYSAFGSYTGNGSSDGPFVYTGFRPRFVLIKNSSASAAWYIYDTARDTYNVATLELNPNNAQAEENNLYGSMDITSNGFKLRFAGGEVNNNTNTFIYAAFAESPFKYALAR